MDSKRFSRADLRATISEAFAIGKQYENLDISLFASNVGKTGISGTML